MAERCSEFIRVKGMAFYREGRCTRQGTVKAEGKWYCTQHDPKIVKERRAKRMKALDAQLDAREKQWRHHDRVQRAYDACKKACELIASGSRPAKLIARDAISKFPKEKPNA